ncbi:hypothetical protein IM697_21975 [Streptomyces ferrugineus]|uniref:Uncharacterized protein n=1 Tax=Streptomyces ferrugineus TaxID=1413221 RepID=A0A7M2SZ66_9ACTN|nr:hypothetical protein [Streptomyces ferrugineus]QOV40818.1 hypothetical protein IM697_21975 [Streptomyces ferrugineus]
MDGSLPRTAVEPESVIAEVVRTIEPDLDQDLVETVVTDTFRHGPQRRQPASLLQQDPAWLTGGRPESPPVVERFVRALREHGAQHRPATELRNVRTAPASEGQGCGQ